MTLTTGPEQTVAAFFQHVYVPDRLALPSQKSSRAAYRSAIAVFDQHVKSLNQRPAILRDLTDVYIKSAMAAMVAKGRSPATANRVYRTLKAVWGLAYELEILDRRCRTRAYKEIRREPESWLADEVVALLTAAKNLSGRVGEAPACDWWPALLLFCLSTGVRISAAMATPTENLDLDRGEVLIPGHVQKQKSDQRLGLLPSAVEYLDRLAPHGRVKCIFDDWPFDRSAPQWYRLNHRLKSIIVRAGLRPELSQVKRTDLFHKLRKTFASQVAAKAGLPTACALLGHSSMAITKRYIDGRQIQLPHVRDLIADPLAFTTKESNDAQN